MTGNLGGRIIRKDALDKATGKAKYVADIKAENMHYGAVLRSPHHSAKILSIDSSKALEVHGVVAVLTSEDIPGEITHGALIQDQPALAHEVVRHIGEPVALVIASSKMAAQQAKELVTVEYEPLASVHDPIEALAKEAPKVQAGGNLITEYHICDGDVEAGFAEADIIIEDEFSVQRISPGYLEPESSLAEHAEDGTLTVWVSSQEPFEDWHTIARVLGVETEKIRVKSAVIGGAFGGKEDPELQVLAALGAWKTKTTVQMVNSRFESFVGHPKRHPVRFQYKVGVQSKTGKIIALSATAYMDTGAYSSYGPAVAAILTETLAGSYRIPNVEVATFVVLTNSPLSGAMRGFGAPQSAFAIESLVDIIADKIGMDPFTLREKNILKPGDKLFTKVPLDETASALPVCLEKAKEARERLEKISTSTGKVAGIGMALAIQSMGLGAKITDTSTHRLEWLPNGNVRLYLGAPDMGQGLIAVAEQMTAEALQIPFERIETVMVDTARTPNGGVTCASRMTYMAGNAVISAAEAMKKELLEEAGRLLGVESAQLGYENGDILKSDGSRIQAGEITSRLAEEGLTVTQESSFTFPYPKEKTPEHLPIGMPHVMFLFAANVARVEVDPVLGTVEVTHLFTVNDVGKVINRLGVEGQIEGGAATGLGYALYEDVALKGTGQWVDSFTEYLLATTKDMPEIESTVLEIPEASGPYGAKGVGEIVLVPTAPAIANAVFNATAVRIKQLPISAEVVLEGIRAQPQ
jgi:CO/xanthine dehydrogenase Mo-binding subunit